MAKYRFWAHSVDGKPLQGVIKADGLEEARQALEVRRLIADRIVPQPLEWRNPFRRAPSSRAVVEFARQFATLVDSSVPVAQALEMTADLSRDPLLGEALRDTLEGIQAGGGVAESMAEHRRVFGEIFVATVAAGEQGGNLTVVLLRMADDMERTQEIRERVLAALAYPAVIVAAAIGAVATLLVLVVPTFEGIFAGNGMDLPASTLLFVTVSRVFARYWVVVIAVLVGAALALRYWYRSERGRHILDSVVLRLPVGGGLASRLAVARFSRSAAALLASGVPILDALHAAAGTCGNVAIADALSRARESVASGRSLSEQLAREAALPPLLASMVAIGEQTGQLDRMLHKVADFHDREVRVSVDGLLRVVEPILVIVVGVILGATVIAMYLPVVDAISATG